MIREEDTFAYPRIARLAILLALFGALVVFGVARAQAPTPQGPAGPQAVTDDQVNAVARQLYCPVCENVPLDVCGTQACAQWRDLIRLKLSQGWTTQQIDTYFANNYGDRVLAQPPARGLNWLVYILPPLFILGGAYILFRVLRRMRAAPAAQVPTSDLPVSDDPYVARFEEQVRKSE